MMKDDYTQADVYYELICQTLMGYLISNPTPHALYLNSIEMCAEDIANTLLNAKNINKISKKYFVIKKEKIFIKKALIAKLKPYLFNQLVRIIRPQESFLSTFPVMLCDEDELKFDPPKIDFSRLGSPVYRAYVKRFITHECYSAETLQTFHFLAECLSNLQTHVLSPSELAIIRRFISTLQTPRLSWINILSDLLNGKLHVNDDITRYFTHIDEIDTNAELSKALDKLDEENQSKSKLDEYLDSQNIVDMEQIKENISWINSCEKIPALLELQNDKIIVSPTYFENKKAVLPYLLFFMEFGTLSTLIKNNIMCSCL